MGTEELTGQLEILKTEYIRLLNDIDVLASWGKPQLEALYATRIGYLQVQYLQVQLRVRALKEKLERIRSSINQGLPVDILSIELEVAAMLAEAEARIMIETAKIEKAKDLLSHLNTPERSGELRKLYKALAKQLHPDVNPQLTQEQIALWQQVKEAYENGDLEKIKALRVVYEKEIADAAANNNRLTEEQMLLQIETLKEGIKMLQQQINHIKNQFPFSIEQQIKDEEWVAAESGRLKAALQELEDYEQELTLEYENTISSL